MLNAAETTRNLKTTLLEPLLVYVHNKILQAAKEGHFSVQDPHQGYPGQWPTPALLFALWKALNEQGYEVRDRVDTGGEPFTEVSW